MAVRSSFAEEGYLPELTLDSTAFREAGWDVCSSVGRFYLNMAALKLYKDVLHIRRRNTARRRWSYQGVRICALAVATTLVTCSHVGSYLGSFTLSETHPLL